MEGGDLSVRDVVRELADGPAPAFGVGDLAELSKRLKGLAEAWKSHQKKSAAPKKRKTA
jgi:hypothetical protein